MICSVCRLAALRRRGLAGALSQLGNRLESAAGYTDGMQTPRYDIAQPHDYYLDRPYGWIDGEGDPFVAAKRKRFMRIVVIACGALAIMIATFVTVAAYELVTSTDAKLVAQAAKDRTRATTLGMATSAKCDRQISEAKAAGQAPPACAEQVKPDASTNEEPEVGFDVGAVFQEIVKAAAAD
jgi:hypothetical protein